MENKPIKTLNLAVTGSSEFDDRVLLYSTLDKILPKIKYIISGASHNFDVLVREYCQERGLPQLFFYPIKKLPDGTLNKGGVLKNKFRILSISNGALIFSNGSEGTTHFIECCKKKNIYYKVIKF